MKHFLTFLSSVLLPLSCVGAPSYTTYFNNTHTYTNASVAGTARVNSLVVTNGISSAANWTGEGTTNSTLSGEWRSHNGILTNALVIGRGTNSGDDFIDAVRDTSQGDINDGEFRFRVTDGSNYGTLRNYATTNSTGFRWETKRGSDFLRLGADLYADGVGDFNWLYMDVNSVTPVLLDPLNQYGLNLPFKFGTAATISSGNILGVYNNETNVFTVAYNGSITARDGLTLTNTTAAIGAITINQFTGATNAAISVNTAGVSQFKLYGEAANTLVMRNGANGQVIRLYNTYTDASNYERGNIGWSGNIFYYSVDSLGTGSARAMKVGTAGAASVTFITSNTDRWNFSSGGHLLANTDNSYDIGASGATRPRNYFGAGTITSGSTITSGAGVTIAAGNKYHWTGRSGIYANADGIITLTDNAETSFGRLNFGGTASSFPSLKRSSTEIQVRLADDSADGPLKSGQLSNTGIRVMTPSSLQTLAAGNALLANATKVRVVGSGGAVTLTSTPTIADGSDGQYVMIQGTDDTNTLTVQDQGSLASSNLELGAATRVLGAGDVLVLTFDTTASVWYEVSFANN